MLSSLFTTHQSDKSVLVRRVVCNSLQHSSGTLYSADKASRARSMPLLESVTSGSDMESMPLSVLHGNAKEQLAVFKSGRPDAFSDALRTLDQLEKAVDRAGLFSNNEDKDDLQTSCLQYLLAPFLKGELCANSPAIDPAERHRHLVSAEAAYSAYLQQCHQYGLLRNKESQLYAAAEDRKQQDPNSRRTEKIERFKRNKALTGLIEQLQRMKTLTGEDDLVMGLDYTDVMGNAQARHRTAS